MTVVISHPGEISCGLGFSANEEEMQINLPHNGHSLPFLTRQLRRPALGIRKVKVDSGFRRNVDHAKDH
jgi:hypothetical protein